MPDMTRPPGEYALYFAMEAFQALLEVFKGVVVEDVGALLVQPRDFAYLLLANVVDHAHLLVVDVSKFASIG